MKNTIENEKTQPLKTVEKKKSHKLRTAILILIAVFGFLFLMGSCMAAISSYKPEATQSSAAQHSETVTPKEQPKTQQSTPAPTKPKEQKPVQQKSVEQQLQDIAKDSGILGKLDLADSTYDPGDKIFVVFDDIGDGSFGNEDFAKMEVFDIQKAVWTSKLAGQVSEVRVNVTMNLTDAKGNTNNLPVAHAWLTKDNASTFNWQNTYSKAAWEAYDNTWLKPGDGWK
jgi:hypothetical protein